MYKTKIYKIWVSMRHRCRNQNDIGYKTYGGAGISVCKEWQKFDAFYRDMGDRPPGKSLDRIDNKKGYSKKNCRWATPKEQARNTSTNVLIKFRGKSRCIAEWAEVLGVDPETIRYRIKRGWSLKQALTKPPKYSKIEYKGELFSRRELSTKTGLHFMTFNYRINNGWSVEDALNTPKYGRYRDEIRR